MPYGTLPRISPLCSAWLCLVAAAAGAEPFMKTESWPNTEEAFAACDGRIRAKAGANLLAGGGVRRIADGLQGSASCDLLTDGSAGQRCDSGRVEIGGNPTVLTYYLGGPKTIKEVGVFTFNGDTRANQDFEVRLANNSAHPGVMPTFPDKPDLSTGRTVVGADSGGFHTAFVDPQGAPLTGGQVDWVQFRIWGTHGVTSGALGRGRSGGWTAAVELEVLGDEHEVTPPTPEEIAYQQAVRNAPPQPGFINQGTWREALIASREALLQWECEQDRLAMHNVWATLGPWHVLGPLPEKSDAVRQLDQATQIDLSARHEAKDGSTLGWQQRKDLADAQLIELTDFAGAERSDVLYLCRNITLRRDFDRNALPVRLSASQGQIRLLPANNAFGESYPVEPNRRGWAIEGKAGDYQLLVRLATGRDGRRQFWFAPQPRTSRPGAGDEGIRLSRRNALFETARQEFSSPSQRFEMEAERAAGVWNHDRSQFQDWLPGKSDDVLQPLYAAAVRERLARLRQRLADESAGPESAPAAVSDRLVPLLDQYDADLRGQLGTDELRNRFYRLVAVDEALMLTSPIASMRRAIIDQRKTWGAEYPCADEFLARVAELDRKVHALRDRILAGEPDAVGAILAMQEEMRSAKQEILLANPVLRFEKLLLARGGTGFASNWGGPNRLGSEIVILSPVRPDGEITTIHRGSVSDMDLHWDAQRLLFSDGQRVWEINVDGSGLRQVSANDEVTHYDACYLPSGQMMCVSNACEQAVPCTGGANVGNLHVIDADGGHERRVTFDQDHNWNPVVLHDGRVLYTRWEYTDTPHYFSRLLFCMNPDGTDQKEYYGSNSYWPNAMYWPRPIPGHPTMISCVVSGHHGVSRSGELLLLDPARGRHEADGAVQRIPGYGKKVEAITMDQLVVDVWPKFAAPWPLAEPGTNRGAGKYFLVCVQQDKFSNWDLCLVDIFDNITPLLTGSYMTPIPLRPRPKPPVIPARIDLEEEEAVVYVADVYQGPGLKGFPPGSIQQLRIGSHHYRYAGNGDTAASSSEGGWDVKKILGTVPVDGDGSVLFRVPANTPIFVQPLDAEGKSQQVMRSWFSAMPGEVLSCVGCHERQNDVPASKYSAAVNGRRPSKIEPWHGPPRGFSFDREVQPVLDRRCVGCHNGQPYRQGDKSIATIDLRAKQLHAGFEGPYSPAYMALQQYVRRPGYEGDYHMPKPAEYEADTSHLVQLLKKGHYNVQLPDEEWQRLYTWIDFNVPYPVNWRESHRPPSDEQVERRAKYKQLFAKIDDRDEAPLPLPPVADFQPPQPAPPRPSKPLELAGWPLPPEDARALRDQAGPVERQLDMGGDVKMSFVLVPAGKFVMGDVNGFPDEYPQQHVTIERPFFMGRFEVTNQQYAQFDPRHSSGVINERWKDRSRRGTPIDGPDLPVVRISWHEATAFCEWLSGQTGLACTLPTEAQWEWACRAGSDTAFSAGEYTQGMPAFANIADATAQRWNHGRAEPAYNDGVHFTAPGGRFPPNAWGLCDMHGNVAEWCLSTYQPYPYNPADGRDNPGSPGPKVVRGGSWNDTLRMATSASRWRYEPYKPVYNVGFRVVFEATSADTKVAQAGAGAE